jgi:hypothetical protein
VRSRRLARSERQLLSQCGYHDWDAQDVDRPLDVVGQHGEAHLGAHVSHAAGEEVTLVQAVLDRAEGMLDEALASLELLGFSADPVLHLFQQAFVHPARDAAAVPAAGAAGSELTGLAGASGVVADVSTQFGGLEAIGQCLACGAPIAVVLGVVAEVLLGEETEASVGRSMGLGDVGGDAGSETGADLLAVVVAHVGQSLEMLYLEELASADGHGAQLPLVGDAVGHLVIEDELVLGTDADLNIVAHLGAPPSADGHGTCIGIGEGDLLLTTALDPVLERLELLLPFLQGLDLLAQFFGSGLVGVALVLVVEVQLLEVAVDLLVDACQRALQAAGGEVLVRAVDGLEPGAVDGDQLCAEELQFTAPEGELAADGADRLPIVTAEIGNGLEVRGELARQPHQLDVARGFSLEGTAGTGVVEVAVDVQFEEGGGMVRRATGFLRHGVLESQRLQVEAVDEGVDEAHGVVLGDVLVEEVGKHDQLVPVDALDEAHAALLDYAGWCFVVWYHLARCSCSGEWHEPKFLHSLSLEPTWLSGAVGRLVEPAAEFLSECSGPVSPGGSARSVGRHDKDVPALARKR